MAPNGLTITKLAIQISADDEIAHTLLCLKISLPRESDARQGGQWNLFNGGLSKLASDPQVYPLPLAPNIAQEADQVRTAALLLSLSPDSSRTDKPNRSDAPGVHITSAGQVSITLDSSTPRKRREPGPIVANSPGGGLGRREFLVVLGFEQSVDYARGWYKLAVPLPKCLDNVLRFQVLPPRASSSVSTGEVSIVTEPKILPVPPSTFSPRSKSTSPISNGKAVVEDGWEDGESLGPEDMDSESEDGGGSWLEGRFQSTESLNLEWSFASTAPRIPSLRVSPNWHPGHPSISVDYETSLPSASPAELQAVLPEGWGWSDLRMEGGGLTSWACSDGEWWDSVLSSAAQYPDPDVSDITDRPDEDSFATVRARRNLPPSRNLPSLSRSSSGASLMRQPLPQPDPSFDEFSFELNSIPAPPASLRKLARSTKRDLPGVSLDRPAPGRWFELVFTNETIEPTVRITGTLVPLSKTLLVSPSIPTVIPVFQEEGQCHYTPDASIIDVHHPPLLKWVDERGHSLRQPASGAVTGEIAITLQRSRGVLRTTISFPWPKRAGELVLVLPQGEGVEVAKVEMGGRALPRAVIKEDGRLVIGKGGVRDGLCTVVLEVDDEDWGLPVLEGALGCMTVKMIGKQWDALAIATNLTRQSSTSYTITLPPTSPPFFKAIPKPKPPISTSSPSPSHFRAVWSWSTLVNIFMLYLLLSLAQQIQRLRSEVAFVSEEAKDLRMYSTKLEERVGQAGRYWEGTGLGTDVQGAGGGVEPKFGESPEELCWSRAPRDPLAETAPGRVVLSRTGWNWETWVRHPTVATLSKSLGWLWHTVVWLVHA